MDQNPAALDDASKRHLQSELNFQGFYHGTIDGDWGPKSQKAFADAQTYRAKRNRAAVGISPAFSANALALILDAEGIDQPGTWPGGDSGITIGRGDDLGYQSAAEFADKWKALLSVVDYTKLLLVIGFKGDNARRLAKSVANIHIITAQADAVFVAKTLPTYVATTRKAFPGFDALPLDVQGALVSLVYNRGDSMSGDRRKEMRAIRDEVAKPRPDLYFIAGQFRTMKRLWEGQGLDGLLSRREAEACLVARAV